MYLPTLVSVYKLIDVTGHGQIALELIKVANAGRGLSRWYYPSLRIPSGGGKRGLQTCDTYNALTSDAAGKLCLVSAIPELKFAPCSRLK